MIPTFDVSPLSPERACAISISFTLAISSLDHRDSRLNFALRNERRPIRDYFFSLRTARAESCNGRRPVERKRRDFSCESFDYAFVLRPHSNSKHYFGDVRGRWSRKSAVTRVGSDEFGEDFVVFQAQPVESFSHDSIRGLRLLESIGPRIHKRADGLPTGRVAHADFVEFGRGESGNTRESNAVRSRLFEMNACEIGDTIRRYVLARISHFIQELFLDSRDCYPSAGAFVLGDYERAVGIRFDHRIADVRRV